MQAGQREFGGEPEAESSRPDRLIRRGRTCGEEIG
jgi:hypothetical protein